MYGRRFHSLAEKDPSAALEEASQVTDGKDRASAYHNIGFVLGEKGLDETLKVAGTLGSADQQAFMNTALSYINYKNPKDAAALVAQDKIELSGDSRRVWLETIGATLTEKDPAYAREWLASLPEAQQPDAMKGIAIHLARADILGLSSMLESRPRDPNWAAGVRVLIENIQGFDPERAGQWRQQLEKAGFK